MEEGDDVKDSQPNASVDSSPVTRASLFKARLEYIFRCMWCFTYEAFHRFIIDFDHGPLETRRIYRYFVRFYNFYIITLFFRMIITIFTGRRTREKPFQTVDLFVQMFLLHVIGQDSYMLLGITLVLVFPSIVTHYNLYRIHKIFKATFEDIDDLYLFISSAQLNPFVAVMKCTKIDVARIINSISVKFKARTSPYLLKGERAKIIILFQFLQIFFFFLDFVLGKKFLNSWKYSFHFSLSP